MTTQLASNFEQEVDEYVSRLTFRRRLKSWLSASNTWFSCLGGDRCSTREYSYDTEQLDILLLLNGLKSEASSVRSSCTSSCSPRAEVPSMASAWEPTNSHSKPPGDSNRPPTTVIARRKRLVELCRRFKSGLRKSDRSRSSANPWDCKTPAGPPWVFEDEETYGPSRLWKQNSHESHPAQSTNILALLEMQEI
ncbi:LANO_0A05116g1_1 [Lachancea nothofagi CBS 11611]|uniref:LANO_0A05116g1_1 n=1 Tax=Lachancea nothofagi CBS 11611 TaxID=1266666 RepID=A0A1G4IQQ1_9SACH|nr:LANO_0A05116g1_1 [Lachancea nothofagi CBS 11611]